MALPVAWAVATLLAVAPGPSPAELAARDAYELARDGRVAQARALLRDAYDDTGEPALLYVRGTLERDQDNCELAIDYFDRFVATDPPAQDAARAHAEIDTCREVLDSRAPPPTPTSAPVAAIPAAPAPDVPRRSRLDPVGLALVVGGGAVAITGLGLLVSARVAMARADAATEGDFDADVDRLRTRHRAGIGLAAAGGAALVTGAIVWIVRARRPDRRTATRLRWTTGGLACAF